MVRQRYGGKVGETIHSTRISVFGIESVNSKMCSMRSSYRYVPLSLAKSFLGWFTRSLLRSRSGRGSRAAAQETSSHGACYLFQGCYIQFILNNRTMQRKRGLNRCFANASLHTLLVAFFRSLPPSATVVWYRFLDVRNLGLWNGRARADSNCNRRLFIAMIMRAKRTAAFCRSWPLTCFTLFLHTGRKMPRRSSVK